MSPKIRVKGTEIKSESEYKYELPILPLREQMVFPFVIFPIVAGRKGSVDAVQLALNSYDNKIFVVTQKKNAHKEKYPTVGDLYKTGTICTISQMFRLPDGTLRVILQGERKASVVKYFKRKDHFHAELLPFPTQPVDETTVLKGYVKTFLTTIERYLKMDKGLPGDLFKNISMIKNPYEIFYFALANLEMPLQKKQYFFDLEEINDGLQELVLYILEQIEVLKIQNDLESKVKKQITKSQKEYFLNEQLKVIHKELGIDEDESDNLVNLKKRIAELKLPDEVRKKAEEEYKKLTRLSPHMPEYFVVYNYISWILDLPWEQSKSKEIDIAESQTILDRDHYGLEKVKDRILEYLAVLKISDKVKGQIICFVGPPGVGKTSLGKSIAESLGREFIRISLGGVRDEAEIRGHRRTYVGAIPGVIIQSMKKAGSLNPLIMLDEIDKMSMDFKGDPASALLEVLDPEQNKNFRDHYLDFGYDLSQVLFITTANSVSNIPRPLYDRMEVIAMPGYTEIEKKEIALRHLLRKKIDELNIREKLEITINENIVLQVIQKYTREAGVRELERKLGTILRKIVKKYVANEVKEQFVVTDKDLREFLGAEPYLLSEVPEKDTLGVVVGLAWTPVGGDILLLEALKHKGNGKISITGKIGQVMQESAKAAYSYARSHCQELGIPEDFYKSYDLHIHVPEGAVPKDGPSAGVGLATIIVSIFADRPVCHHVAMTGEVTLTGRVLAIGGLAQKLMAAKRTGIKKVIIPKANIPDFEEVKPEIKEGMEFVFVETIDEVLSHSLHPIQKVSTDETKPARKKRKSGSVE
ncbi:MAG TPA: endopeptidase La [Candidatus Cloacimonadota bacterium]|nr:endopeptidase La [Candidatus Cloacimonadota bacterium]